MIRIKIENTDVFLEDFEPNQGKITISDTHGHNYSTYWGAMGSNICEFIIRINGQYFADKLLGSINSQVFDSKKTFKAVRRFIREEFCLPWYKHIEFQKQMRETLKDFESRCESENDFVSNWQGHFIDKLDFYLIGDKYDRQSIESDFQSIDTVWDFMETKYSPEYKWLIRFHTKLIKAIKSHEYQNIAVAA